VSVYLRRLTAAELLTKVKNPACLESQSIATQIVEDVRLRGEAAVREHAERLGDVAPGAPLVIEQPALDACWQALPAAERELLQRVKGRIESFAEAQKACLRPLAMEIEGGIAGHNWLPVQSVGAYAPGGSYPLPSSVLMTVVPAKVAGVASVWLASPRPAPITLAAAALCGVDGVLAFGGAQAIAALAFGTFSPAASMLVGPGNQYVTAAKKHLFGEVGIDALAGPSELVVIADEFANPRLVALDLLAQAEHDAQARPILITTDEALIWAVEDELDRELAQLPTAPIARQALQAAGCAVLVDDLAQAAKLSDELAPEHLQLCVQSPGALSQQVRCYGGLFLGELSAEVFGDYGAGPNHVLPTAGGARFQAGLSVATFLRASTYLQLSDAQALRGDTAQLARLEGLEAHARASSARGPQEGSCEP
jgi:phosphoribosyl-ATP pyrophosphohydrolase/phosphoribosyl-AMP cyclohydrolase/histidinol dehydrogenase